MIDDRHNQLIDKVYEASFLSDRWPDVLDDVSAIAGCDKGLLFAIDGQGVGGTICNPKGVESMRAYQEEGWGARDSMTSKTMLRREPCFLTTQDIFEDGELEKTAYFRDFMIPRGHRWSTGTIITSPSGNLMVIACHRSAEFGPVERESADRLTELRPHLARATLTSARLRLEQAKASVQALNAIGLPACAISALGKYRVANPLFDALVPFLVEDRQDRLHFKQKEPDALFGSMLERWKNHMSGRSGRTFPIKATEDLPAHIIHLIPIAGDNRDIFSSAQWIVLAVPVAISERIDFTLLEGLFDLTVSEAAIAGRIATGKTLQDVAAERSVSIETVRTQLKSILYKTGTNRQAELVGLLSRVSS